MICKLNLSLSDLVLAARVTYDQTPSFNLLGSMLPENLVLNFLKERIEGILLEQGIRYDVANAVLSNFDNPLDAKLRADALSELRKEKDFEKTVTVFSRVINILPVEKKNKSFGLDKESIITVDEARFENDAEKQLYAMYKKISNTINDLVEKENISSHLLKCKNYVHL